MAEVSYDHRKDVIYIDGIKLKVKGVQLYANQDSKSKESFIDRICPHKVRLEGNLSVAADWCKRLTHLYYLDFSGGPAREDYGVFNFQDRNDALIFKLTWAGR